MSSLKFGKKLLPATKAWKSFTSTLQKKLHKLKRSKAIKKTTKHLNTTLSSVLGRNQSKSPRLSSIIGKKRTKSPRYKSKKRVFIHLHQQHHQLKQSTYAPIYIDQLFKESLMVEQPIKLPKLVITDSKNMGEKSKGIATEEPTSSATLAALQKFRGVDERAEEFIYKFKEEMRLQRQRSFGEYQEMLARGVQ